MKKPERPLSLEPQPKSPFPTPLPDGRIVIDELCRCGALRSAHEAVLGVAFGHGACAASGCKKFTYKAFVLKGGEFA